MAIPFKLNPEPPKQPADSDPFLEFDSERPGVRPRTPSHESLLRPELPDLHNDRSDEQVAEPSLGLREPPQKSAINPALAFAIGVAGLVTATVAYYQLVGVLSSRSTPSQAASTSPVSDQRAAPPPATGTGRVDVASNPPGALVSLNGDVRGVTPLILTGLPAGLHTIVISRDSFSTTRTIDLGPGHATAVSVAIPYSGDPSTLARTAQSQQRTIGDVSTGVSGPAGWLTFDVPIDLQVYQDGRLRGNTRDGRVTLAAGQHNVVLANAAFEYREVISVRVPPGGTTRANVSLPTGYLSLNALPWAEVWVDGSPVGTTPLANLSLPIGSHEVLWRHPILGDRRQIVIVKAKTPARAGVDLNR